MDRPRPDDLGSPSKTAIWALAGRAIGSRVPEERWRNPDQLAEKLLGPEEIALLGEHPLAAALRDGVDLANPHPEVLAASVTMLVRTRFIDAHLEEAVSGGAWQIVFLGAGFDTRAYRLRDRIPEVRIFEVDLPATPQWKRRRAQEALGDPPENLTYVAVDFRQDSLNEKLLEAGYDPSLKTFFVWEGVTMYLTEAAIDSTLQWVARQAPGSCLVFDFASRELIDLTQEINETPGFQPQTDAEYAAAARARNMARWGEPWIFGMDPDQVAAFLAERGLELGETMSFASREAAQRYLDWNEALPFPPQIRAMYLMADAAVPAS